jgi:arylsulfatase
MVRVPAEPFVWIGSELPLPVTLGFVASKEGKQTVNDQSSGNNGPLKAGVSRRNMLAVGTALATTSLVGVSNAVKAQPATGNKPNIIVIMGDDIGWSNIGVYNQGIMAGRTPNLDRMANEGMRFTDYYAEASCTAGRANFITGELPIRTGLTTVGQAGAPLGIPDEAVTIAHVLKSMGYATGQFGKNHLGDLNKFLPTVHGFDEFWGYLYHLDAMQIQHGNR